MKRFFLRRPLTVMKQMPTSEAQGEDDEIRIWEDDYRSHQIMTQSTATPDRPVDTVKFTFLSSFFCFQSDCSFMWASTKDVGECHIENIYVPYSFVLMSTEFMISTSESLLKLK